VICIGVGLSYWRASPRDDILETGKIAAVGGGGGVVIILAAMRPLILPAVLGHRRRSPPSVHAITDLTALLSRLNVASSKRRAALDVVVGRQQSPVMVITVTVAMAHWAYKFTCSHSLRPKSTEHSSSSLSC
jgi:hypothetical protein